MPIGVPGCPELAFSTASMARVRIVLTQMVSRSPEGRDLGVIVVSFVVLVVGAISLLLLVVAAEALAHG
jgi:hypothetical protein